MQKLHFLTPSYIDSEERILFATKAVDSLQDCMVGDFILTVVDDSVGHRFTFGKKNYQKAAREIYSGKEIEFVERGGRGSCSATIHAAKLAKAKGAQYVFLHLDDHIYIPELKRLTIHSTDAFDRNPDLMEIRLSGEPILSNNCSKELGNRSMLSVTDEQVSFGKVVMQPKRYDDYTLWSSFYHDEMIEGFWPIVLWSTVYRIDFLLDILEVALPFIEDSLGAVELFYKEKNNWGQFIARNPGRIGYINMQFCGLEMHRNKNWKELICFPNIEVR